MHTSGIVCVDLFLWNTHFGLVVCCVNKIHFSFNNSAVGVINNLKESVLDEFSKREHVE
jgi:hypothetical protein